MATKIPTEILIKILNNIQSTQDFYSSLLVNRFWCKVTIPILWELTFFSQKYLSYKELEQRALCIRTYISCMDIQARTLLIQNGFDLSSSPPQVTFDYPSFTHKVIINDLVSFISIYSQIIADHYSDSDEDYELNVISIPISRILFREICKLIINRCTFLDHIILTEVREIFRKNFSNYSDSIGSILKLPGALKVIKKLESFTSTIENCKSIRPFYESLTLICDNILIMDLSLNSNYQLILLAKLISVQKQLESLSIFTHGSLDHNSLIWTIINQKKTLKSLRLKSLNFCYLKRKSSPIGQFISLQKLYIENCRGLYESDCLFLASSFTQLSSFHYFHYFDYFHLDHHEHHPQKFIIKIFETANTNLKNVCLNLYSTIPFDIFSAILNYCTKITRLSLYSLSSEQVIAILNNNFNELRRFSFDCGKKKFDANELLCQMAENVPESLETIEIRMDNNNQWLFNADSLRKFFEGWCSCKGGGGGNKKLRRLRAGTMSQKFSCSPFKLKTMGIEHKKVIEEYGIQFDTFNNIQE